MTPERPTKNGASFNENSEALDIPEGLLRSYLEKKTDLGPSGTGERICKTNPSLTSTWKALYDSLGKECTGRTEIIWCLNSITNTEIGIVSDAIANNWNGIQIDYIPDGSEVKVQLPREIGQGGSNPWANTPRGDGEHTIGQASCIDCCLIMAVEYFNGVQLDVAKICSSMKADGSGGYVIGQEFQYVKFLHDYGLEYRRLNKSTQEIVAELARGNVCEFCIGSGQKGVKVPWYDENGELLHETSQHHMLIVGYTDEGFYIADPGCTALNGRVIPYEVFANGPIRYVNVIYPTQGQSPKYEFNTIK